MYINGEYYPNKDELSTSVYSICRYITDTPLGRLFSFNVKPEILTELEKTADKALKKTIDRELKSKKIMEMMI